MSHYHRAVLLDLIRPVSARRIKALFLEQSVYSKKILGQVYASAWACIDLTFIALGSTIQASRHKPQPTHSSGLITGLVDSQVNAPGTGQLDSQTPHSGPL